MDHIVHIGVVQCIKANILSLTLIFSSRQHSLVFCLFVLTLSVLLFVMPCLGCLSQLVIASQYYKLSV